MGLRNLADCEAMWSMSILYDNDVDELNALAIDAMYVCLQEP